MDGQHLEALVSGGLSALDLQVEGCIVDGNPAVHVVDPVPQPPRLVAVIIDHQSDLYSLSLGGYIFRDFAYQPADEVQLVSDFCKVVAAYLRGEGTRGVTTPRFRLLGRPHPYLSFVIDGQLWSGGAQEK